MCIRKGRGEKALPGEEVGRRATSVGRVIRRKPDRCIIGVEGLNVTVEWGYVASRRKKVVVQGREVLELVECG